MRTPLLQRACDCGQHTHGEGECEECKKKREVQLRRDPAAETTRAPWAADGATSGAAREFTSIPVRAGRLTVAPSDDRFEQEAERVADRVVAGTAFVSSTPASTERQVQRQDDDVDPGELDIEDEEAEIEGEEFEGEDDEVLDEPDEEGIAWDLTPDASGRPKLEAEVSASGRTIPVAIPETSGTALQPAVRSLMERRIGHDFGRVRVHTDDAAGHSASALRAHAYTVGSDIYFARGQYAPASAPGQRLLAHELAHVVQQTGGGSTDGVAAGVQRKPTGVRRKGRGRKGADKKGGYKKGDKKGGDKKGGGKKAGSAAKNKAASPATAPKPKLWKAGGCTCEKHPITCATGECTKCPRPGSRKVRSPVCGNETCSSSGAANSQDFIRHISVNRSTQMFNEHWGTATKEDRVEGPFLCSPELGDPSNGRYKIGVKCGLCHTNCCGDGMGWFTSFHQHLLYGFHNSQPVAKGVQSHGCIRVGSSRNCGPAKRIHDNTASGKTTVCIHDGDECAPKPRPKSTPKRGAPSKRAAGPNVSAVEAESGGRERETLVEEILS